MADAPQLAPLNYESPTRSRHLRVWGLVLALPAPTAVMAAYLTLTRWPSRHFTIWSDWLGLLASIGVGAGVLAASKLRGAALLFVLAVYVPLQLVWLFLFSLDFVCSVFGDCL